ncbi:bifunctional diaminohydroxyphosphoribosylaminopyrimidine deaminase/5-amino-6-(5-phosphoribosylamino)uracil reductase RibD [Niabella ginsengisoli]|uniref:Riboflavin biosynthesis protein RibD n=1 Tax=Niabella ginsengisoli TaxID=522298 RepID=A0ABS9SHS0_9BACT|nr:bifunctional diaminohydroxyphosphoribosylaminopyrimidine deaminase/5-amino-6-(5-phosphoribosylamino)uracil reductase RibD [Niabella ginsengisoli]MCH5597918.1 bifunctional diaminohydroxyphosphoribosylaminopyrimidine deaminase/5-amino-6-(5-phosphoribosylamino)uracil reductase RibD [Niabella ginsengisoli]
MYQVHERYMQRCLQLAKLAVGNVAPNPMVGAVLVHADMIIGEGYHQQYGGAHAEVNCINDALQNHPEKIAFSTLYVSLEPCAHYGKTPPCADLIIQHKIPEVIIGCRDSFEKVDGKGIEKLRKAGVKVTVGVMEADAVQLNKAFFTFHQSKRPYVILKWAETADGLIAGTGSNRLMISNEYSARVVHKWRSESAAIMVGANTASKDDPLLDNRYWFSPSPKKIIFDPHLKVSATLRLFNGNDVVIILNTQKDAVSKNIIYLKINKADMIQDAMHQLFSMEIQSVFVEGGQRLLQSFIDAEIWDEAFVITNKNLFAYNGLPSPALANHIKLNEQALIGDQLIHFKNKNNQFVNAATGLF